MRRTITNFRRNQSGNVAMMFGLLAIPLLIGAGMSVDFLRAAEARARISEASDAGLLAAARAKLRDMSITDAAATATARRHFDANAKAGANLAIDTFDFSFDQANNRFTLQVAGAMKTSLLSIAGRDHLPINVLSEATIAPPRILEAVLVLDNTQSMSGAKMSALKTSAADLVDTIMANSNNKVKVGVVPFSTYVNVGLSRRYASWIDVPADYSETEWDCDTEYPDATSSSCTTITGTCSDDGVEYTCSYDECVWDYGEPVEECKWKTRNNVWRGCVGSRAYPLNVKDEGYAVNRVPGILNDWCPEEILPMTTNKASVLSKIQNLSVQGDTYIPAGLSWGLRLLSPGEPFTEGTTYETMEAEAGVKALILMTDGANTRSPQYPDHWGTNVSLANTLTRELCDEIKSKKIFIHTIAFEVTDNAIKNLLEDCASDKSNYYSASDAAALAAAFNSIGDDLKELALTR